MLRKQPQGGFISTDDIPVQYLSMPVEDRFNPDLESFNAMRRAQPDFKTTSYSPNVEKLYRLYFYQGMSQPDRLIVHSELLENRSALYFATTTGVCMTILVYVATAYTIKYAHFKRVRLGIGLMAGWTWYDFLRRRSANQLESATKHLYELYQIK